MSAFRMLRFRGTGEGCTVARGGGKVGISLHIGGTKLMTVDLLEGHQHLFVFWYTQQVEELHIGMGGGGGLYEVKGYTSCVTQAGGCGVEEVACTSNEKHTMN